MTSVDPFESVFRAADKTHDQPRQVELQSIAVVTDLPRAEAEAFGARVRRFLGALDEPKVRSVDAEPIGVRLPPRSCIRTTSGCRSVGS